MAAPVSLGRTRRASRWRASGTRSARRSTDSLRRCRRSPPRALGPRQSVVPLAPPPRARWRLAPSGPSPHAAQHRLGAVCQHARAGGAPPPPPRWPRSPRRGAEARPRRRSWRFRRRCLARRPGLGGGPAVAVRARPTRSRSGGQSTTDAYRGSARARIFASEGRYGWLRAISASHSAVIGQRLADRRVGVARRGEVTGPTHFFGGRA